jgi:hypothetical protein
MKFEISLKKPFTALVFLFGLLLSNIYVFRNILPVVAYNDVLTPLTMVLTSLIPVLAYVTDAKREKMNVALLFMWVYLWTFIALFLALFGPTGLPGKPVNLTDSYFVFYYTSRYLLVVGGLSAICYIVPRIKENTFILFALIPPATFILVYVWVTLLNFYF